MALSGFLLLSCISRSNWAGYSRTLLGRYQFQNSQVLGPASRAELQLEADSHYVLFAQYYRDFISTHPGKERLYIIGEQMSSASYDLLLLIPHIAQPFRFSFGRAEGRMIKDFVLSVKDFSGDGLDDLFFGFERGKPFYYLYHFRGAEFRAIVRPSSPLRNHAGNGLEHPDAKPFMREVSADIYPAFIAEIELDLNYIIHIDLSRLAAELIRDGIYDRKGMVLQKRGIPHLDGNPILYPVKHKSGQYMLRSVQQVFNRYGQIGIFVCNWHYRQPSAGRAGRWIPDELSMEFLAKPRI